MKTATLLSAVSLILITPVLGETTLKGKATDSSGGAISGAMVIVHWDSSGSGVGLNSNVGIRKDLIIKTDDEGVFDFNLPPGFYDVFFSAMGFTPACRKIRIGVGPAQELTVRMEVDPLVANELGFQISPVAPKR
jgi:hypothetical protein